LPGEQYRGAEQKRSNGSECFLHVVFVQTVTLLFGIG
jgi:hypothetical protein